MGSGSSAGSRSNNEDINNYKQTIQQNISIRRLKLNHHSNIYAKCEYLLAKYNEYAEQFDELHLTHNMISIQFMLLLARMNLSNLKALVLSLFYFIIGNNDIDCQALKCIKQMPLRTLEYLFLDSNCIGNDGCYYLTLTNLQCLLTLDLNQNKIEDDGCKNLARANLPNLRTLLINKNKFNEKGLMYLSKGQWPLLAFIQAKQNLFQPTKELEKVRFRSEIKVFRLEIQ